MESMVRVDGSGSPIVVFEAATTDNFYPQGYMRANADLRVAGVDPAKHFADYGIKENRRQVTRAFLENDEYWQAKYRRFAPLLQPPRHGWRRLAAAVRDSLRLHPTRRFPIVLGRKYHSLDDYSAESASLGFAPFLAEVEANPDRDYLDLGCGLRDRVHRNCLYLEVYPSLTADLIVEPDRPYPIKDASLDGIGCFAVLEHTRRPWEVVAEIRRMLKPGGKAFIDWPFLQPVHGYPSHYYNATREGLAALFTDTGFDIEAIGTREFQGPDWTIHWILGKFVHGLPPEHRDRLLGMSLRDLIDHQPQDTFWQDILRATEDTTRSEFACGNTLIARRR